MNGTTERGLALVVVLWVLVLLALVAASFAKTTRTEVNMARNIIDNAKAEALAPARPSTAWPPSASPAAAPSRW